MAERIMKQICNQSFDEERAFYASSDIEMVNCRFVGPADGESAFKESSNISVKDCCFELRYPFWHGKNLKIENCTMTDMCRAALWYSEDIEIADSKLHGIKALRECDRVSIENSDVDSPEFGWFSKNVDIKNSTLKSEYFMLKSNNLKFFNTNFSGKYSFQYVTDATIENSTFDTKDAFWHGKDIYIKNCRIKGEYLAWYSENLTFENCIIEGTQPFCYCKNLKLINCQMLGADLAFEKSDVDAELTAPIISIKNPASGRIIVPKWDELIADDMGDCEIIQGETR